jgi:actin-related protein
MNFNYHRAFLGCGRRSKLAKATTQICLAGGMTLIPTMKQRLAAPVRPRRPGQNPESEGHQGVGQERSHRRGDDAL